MKRGSTIAMAACLALLLFLSGGVLGWSVSHLGSPQDAEPEFSQSPRPSPKWVESVQKRLSHRLDLDEQQEQALGEVLEHRVQRLNEVYAQIEPELNVEFEALQQDLQEILDDGQYERWQRMLKRMERGRDGSRGPRGHRERGSHRGGDGPHGPHGDGKG